MNRRGFLAGLLAVPIGAYALRSGRTAERSVRRGQAAAIGTRAAIVELERGRGSPLEALDAADKASDAYELGDQQRRSPDITVTGRRPHR